MDVLSGFPSLQFPDIPELDEMDTEVYEHSTWLTDDPVEEEEEIENHSWFGYAAKIANDSVRALIGTEFEGSKQERDRHRRQHEAWQRELEEFEAKRQTGAFLSSRSSNSTSSISRRSLSGMHTNHKRLKSRSIHRYRKHHLAPLLKSTMSLPSGLNEHFTHTNIAGNIGRITEAIDDDCSSNRSSDAGTMSSATASHTSSVDCNHNMINYRHYSSEQQRRRTLRKKKYSSLSRKKRKQMKIGQVSSDNDNGNGVGVGAESSLNMRVSDMVTLLPSTTSVMVDGVISSAADDEEESFVSTDESSALVALNFCTPSSGALIDWPHHSHTFHQHHHQTIGNDDCRTVCSDSLVPCSSSYHDRSSVLIDDSSDQNALLMSHNSDDSLSGVIRRDRRSRKRVWMDNNDIGTKTMKRSNSYPLRSRKLTRVRDYQHGQDLGCLVVYRPLDDDGLYHHNSTTDDDNCSTPVIISSDLQSNGGESSTTNNSWCVC